MAIKMIMHSSFFKHKEFIKWLKSSHSIERAEKVESVLEVALLLHNWPVIGNSDFTMIQKCGDRELLPQLLTPEPHISAVIHICRNGCVTSAFPHISHSEQCLMPRASCQVNLNHT